MSPDEVKAIFDSLLSVSIKLAIIVLLVVFVNILLRVVTFLTSRKIKN